MRSCHAFLSIAVAVVVLLTAPAHAGRPEGLTHSSKTSGTATNDQYRPLLINTIFNYYSNSGSGSYNPFSASNEGFEFPAGSRLTTVFQDGIVWGASHNDSLKVGGSVYRTGIQAGRILVNGTGTAAPVPDDPSLPANRVYRVRKDVRPLAGVVDPGDPRASTERALLEREEIPLIGRYESVTSAALLQQYWDDWNTWPAHLGAPYTDVDHDGSYDPAIDIPGPPMADQALWYVANDIDRARTQSLSGTDPIGLEMQRSIWAYRRPSVVGNAVFMMSRLINKSGVPLDSVYLVQWADPDLGDAGDDLVACDTLLGLGYAYNARDDDYLFGSTPPASGFVLVQGPMVDGSAADTAFFGFARRPGHRNLPMSAFAMFTAGYRAYTDPPQGTNGYLSWHNLMLGRSSAKGDAFIDPTTGDTTRFVFAGDPVTGAGWNDGVQLMPGDRRLCMVTGPFTLAAGDTQEIAVVHYVTRGRDRLASVTAFKGAAGVFHDIYRSLSSGMPLPPVTHTMTRNAGETTLSFQTDVRGTTATGVTIHLKSYDDVTVSSVVLADDGNHDDGTAGDGLFGGSVTVAARPYALYADEVITYANGAIVPWTHLIDNISTALVTIASYGIASDNRNSDGVPNPGENVRYVIALSNASPVDLTHLVITASPEYEGHQLTVEVVHGASSHAWTYDPDDPASYLAFDVPSWFTDSTLMVMLTIADSSKDVWSDTLVFPVRPWKSRPYATPLMHVTGTATGSFEIRIVDSSKVQDHVYAIRGVEPEGVVAGYAVKDSTTGVVLLENHPLPDELGHTSPVIDGFKVLRGSIDIRPGMRSWDVPSGYRRFSHTGGYSGIGLEGFLNMSDPEAYDRTRGTIGMAGQLVLCGIGTTLGNFDYDNVVLKLAAVQAPGLWDPRAVPSDANISRAYRYLDVASSAAAESSFTPWIVNAGSGIPYQGYEHSVPFSAWSLATDPPTRLAVGCMESNVVGGLVDGRYWPGTMTGDNSVAREIAFVFRSPYTETPEPAFAVDLRNNASMPLMWVIACARRTDLPWVAGDEFAIRANHLPTPADLWTFNPSVVTGVAETPVPSMFALSQNYPNPFNPSTKLQCTIASRQVIDVRVYDILGRLVVTLVNEVRDAGTYTITWDAGGVASGVYICRMVAGSFTQARKLVVLH